MNLDFIKSNTEVFAKQSSIKELEKVIIKASELYYGDGLPMISDIVYDILIDELETRDSTNMTLKKIGFKSDSDKVELPHFMGSMNKIKTKDGVSSWMSKYSVGDSFIISDKLDGISVLYSNNNLSLEVETPLSGFILQFDIYGEYININIHG